MHALLAQGRQTKNLCKTKPDLNTHTKKKKTTLKMMQISFKYDTEKLRSKSFFLGMCSKEKEK
jgi:hypothetical protein